MRRDSGSYSLPIRLAAGGLLTGVLLAGIPFDRALVKAAAASKDEEVINLRVCNWEEYMRSEERR